MFDERELKVVGGNDMISLSLQGKSLKQLDFLAKFVREFPRI